MLMRLTRYDSSNQHRTQRGASRLTLFVFGTLFAVVAYAAYCILPFYYYYFELHNQFTAIIPKAAELTDKQIRIRLATILKQLEIPADAKDIKIIRNESKLRLVLSYDEIFYIRWRGKDYDLHTFHFDLDVENVY